MKERDFNQDLIWNINKILTDIGCEQFQGGHQALETIGDRAAEMGIQGMTELEDRLETLHKNIESLNWLNGHLRILADFALTCAKTLNEEVLLRKAYELVSRVMPTDAFFLATVEEEKNIIYFPFLIDDGNEYHGSTLELGGDSFTSNVIKEGKTIHLKSENDIDQVYETVGDDDTKTCIFVPLIIDEQVRGVISAQSHKEFAFRKEHEELLLIIGNQVLSSIETARLYKKIYELSILDEMTGLGNFRAFHNDISKALDEVDSLALIMLDSDNLKGINDNYGHENGDYYLTRLAEGMKTLCNEDIGAYRYAGDEFMFILRSPTKDKVEAIITKLDEYLTNHPLNVKDGYIKVAFSAGTSKYPEDGTTVEELKRVADQELYKAKNVFYI
ncbi:sensor domain-containing diguanylate cyclase [Peribacillus alkalitolerans]|uniref:sensor domain-containing diguanylate cyclase n=1 Tax=Peribacillus alkalitolerans TaxID=1550385 RepID=UPI0013D85B71|nr:sensor domain-containing diguanylate cyclase [Peribacillus alkalitolerans]